MHDDTGFPHVAPAAVVEPRDRRTALGLLALLLAAPLLASCKDVQPGSGVQTIEQSRQRSPPSGR